MLSMSWKSPTARPLDKAWIADVGKYAVLAIVPFVTAICQIVFNTLTVFVFTTFDVVVIIEGNF